MSDSNKLKTFNVKKDKKRQAKKRKLEAFLNLVRQDELTPVPGKKKSGGTTFQESYKALKDELKKYQKVKSTDPSFSLKDEGRSALVNFSADGEISKSTLPLFSEDLYHLLLTSVLGNVSPFSIRWATLKCPQNLSKTVLFEIESLSLQNATKFYSELENCNLFPFVAEVVSSNMSFASDLSTMHLNPALYSESEKTYSMFPMDEKPDDKAIKPDTSEYKVSKVHLLLSPIQLAMEHYPLPQDVFEQSKSDGYCFSKDKYTGVSDESPMFAVDCEMCRTVSGRQEVTRIAIVNEKMETIYHTLVKPKEDIIDYATKFSGVTEKMLRNVTTTLDKVQKDMRDLLPSDAILCGQSLNCDLHSLKMIHPYVIDTSIIFNEHGIRHKKTSLKQLARIHLKESIQDGKTGHNPIEDSIATMRLVQLKLMKGIEYGDAVLSQVTEQSESDMTDDKNEKDVVPGITEEGKLSSIIKLNPSAKENGFFSRLERFSKTVCLIGRDDSLNNYFEEMITDNVTKVVKSSTQEILKTTADNVPKFDLVLGHLFSDAENCPVEELKNEIMKTYATFPSKTLFVILLSGINEQPDEKFKHRYCMLTIKK